jgi:hypothetical protein
MLFQIKKIILITLIVFLILFIFTGIMIIIDISEEGSTMYNNEEKLSVLEDISEEAIKELNNKKIFFGHQSVGFNIIDGIEDIVSDNHVLNIKIKEYGSISDFKNYNFLHLKVGENTKPDTKVESFCSYIADDIARYADIVFLKFCYVDINYYSDINAIFNNYKTSINKLKEQYPDTVFVHFTVPLEKQEINIIQSLKNVIKKIIGRNVIKKYQDNLRRSEYNEMILNEYEGKEPVFDLARIESIYPDGKRLQHKINNETYYSMIPEYTDDGGHLNENGRRHVAEQLLIFLANL